MAARVVVVDDEVLVRAGCRSALAGDPDVEVVAAVDGHEALPTITRSRPDVVLLELRLSTRDGWELLVDIVSLEDPPAVAVLTAAGSREHVGRALSAGASGFLDKDSDPRRLPALVRSVAAGGVVLSPAASRRIVDHHLGCDDETAVRRLTTLTCRERQVLARLATGASNVQIGAALHLSRGTVKGHVSAILAKLGVASRLEAALVAERGRRSRRDAVAS